MRSDTNGQLLSSGMHAIVHTSCGHPVASDAVVLFCWSTYNDLTSKENQSYFKKVSTVLLRHHTIIWYVKPLYTS